jgi:hypothetical protein
MVVLVIWSAWFVIWSGWFVISNAVRDLQTGGELSHCVRDDKPALQDAGNLWFNRDWTPRA